jgi:hypothetical protein
MTTGTERLTTWKWYDLRQIKTKKSILMENVENHGLQHLSGDPSELEQVLLH